jgi:hypothetical protein
VQFETSARFNDPTLQLQAEAAAEEQTQALTDSAAEMKARGEKQEANDEAVEAMREQATAIRTGGIVSGSMTMAGGALQMGGTGTKGKAISPYLNTSSDMVGKSADAANSVMGQAPAKQAEADATAARSRAEQKQWAADDAKERRQRAEKQQDTATNQIQQELQQKRETTSFLLQRM